MFDIGSVVVPGACAGAVLSTTDPEVLGDLDLVAYLQGAERQAAHVQALIARATVELTDRVVHRVEGASEGLPGANTRQAHEWADRTAAIEVGAALRVGAGNARDRIRRARDLAGRLLPARDALHTGQLSTSQLWVLQRETEALADDTLVRAVQRDVLSRATTQSTATFARSIRTALSRHDPTAAAQQHRAAARDRTGTFNRAIDAGLGQLVVTAPAAQTQWAEDTLDALARALHRALLRESSPDSPADQAASQGVADARTLLAAWRNESIVPVAEQPGNAEVDTKAVPSISELRAWILLDLIARATTDPSFPRERGKMAVEAQVVIDYQTLLGMRDEPGTVNGVAVPAEIAREFAARSTLYRRLVTDPVHGHLLDAGKAFPPPAAIVDHLLIRDLYCRAPGCYRRARACDVEHATSRSQGGDSSVAEMGMYCRAHHTLKTAGLTKLEHSTSDGSVTFVSYLGQRIHVPPRPVLEPAANSPVPLQ